jgi:hypothetical protein
MWGGAPLHEALALFVQSCARPAARRRRRRRAAPPAPPPPLRACPRLACVAARRAGRERRRLPGSRRAVPLAACAPPRTQAPASRPLPSPPARRAPPRPARRPRPPGKEQVPALRVTPEPRPGAVPPPFPEKLEGGLKRYARTLQQLLWSYPGRNVLVVTHGEVRGGAAARAPRAVCLGCCRAAAASRILPSSFPRPNRARPTPRDPCAARSACGRRSTWWSPTARSSRCGGLWGLCLGSGLGVRVKDRGSRAANEQSGV